jgi:hypothetical protein
MRGSLREMRIGSLLSPHGQPVMAPLERVRLETTARKGRIGKEAGRG